MHQRLQFIEVVVVETARRSLEFATEEGRRRDRDAKRALIGDQRGGTPFP
tara:strand:- start:647 stop:796 length:150 start_codon:yes stop_codon:yes gene_type:complete